MKSHQLAKILLEKPDATVVIKPPDDDPYSTFIEASSVAWTNDGHFIAESGFTGKEYDSGRECIQIT